MESIREQARSIVRQMEGIVREFDPIKGRHYFRLAILDYARALRESPHRAPEINERIIESALIFAEKAISLGISQDRMDEALYKIRQHIVPHLAASLCIDSPCEIASDGVRLQDVAQEYL